ncbi:MAG: hypothetical protein DMF68_02445 [Acidobacteria bacterium]|nr:MAG: hypothetical protein DMF68_02445 [Acidobacteriota bacterium]
MKLTSESHKRIESFLRDYFHDAKLKLPPIHVYSGGFARLLTGRLQFLAVTFGRRIFVAPKVMARGEENRLTVPAALIAHEATHVVQYDKAGFVNFLLSYITEYLRFLREQKQGWGRAARTAAYFKISKEREAYEAEAAYPIWETMKSKG